MQHNIKHLLAAIITASIALPVSASAGVYLIDDATNAPTWSNSTIPVNTAASLSRPGKTELPFDGIRSTLDADMNDLIGSMNYDLKKAGQITLTYSGNGSSPRSIAQRHANRLKTKLKDMGITAIVSTEYQTDGRAPSLHMSWTARTAPTLHPQRIETAYTQPPADASFGGIDPTKLFMFQKLMEASAQGKISPDAAISMMRELTGQIPAVAPQPIAVTYAKPQAPQLPQYLPQPTQQQPSLMYASYTQPAARALQLSDSPAPVPQPALDITASVETRRLPTWHLDPASTLKDNLQKWAKKEGYELDWQASNYYKVNRAQTMQGEFLDVVNQIAGAINPTKVALNKSARLIRITD